MTERQRAPFFGRLAWRIIGAAALGTLPALAWFFGSAVPMWVAMGSFLAGGLAAGYLSIRAMKQFRCPRCGAHIPQHEPTGDEENVPILFVCKTCDVEWDTAFRTGSTL